MYDDWDEDTAFGKMAHTGISYNRAVEFIKDFSEHFIDFHGYIGNLYVSKDLTNGYFHYPNDTYQNFKYFSGSSPGYKFVCYLITADRVKVI